MRRESALSCEPVHGQTSWRTEPRPMSIDDLRIQIEETERLIAVYRNANEVIVGTQDEIYSRRGLINRTTLSAAEIGNQIVSILERRLAAMRLMLQKLGAQSQGRSP